MSRFSGKCDFCDEIEIHGIDYILNSRVFVGRRSEPLKLTSIADCVPYFPHIVVSGFYDNEHMCATIQLSEKSWVDIEEERYGHLAIHDIYRQTLREELQKYGGNHA